MPSQMASSTDHESLVVSSNLTSTTKTLFVWKWISSCQEPDKYFGIPRRCHPGSPQIGSTWLVTRWPVYPVSSRGKSVRRPTLGRRSANRLSPLAQRTSAITRWVVRRRWWPIYAEESCTVKEQTSCWAVGLMPTTTCMSKTSPLAKSSVPLYQCFGECTPFCYPPFN